MGIIRILPKDLIAKIAAGEVIERPASAVKELVENSLDAGAKRIQIEIESGGRKVIRVSDDGCGMSGDDLEIAFQGHSTSKITTLNDLFSVQTLGFRGEALSSIAAVSQIHARSSPPGANVGHAVELEEGNLVRSTQTASSGGTLIEVRNLFFNTPVRAKFLKSDATEMGHITDTVVRLALAEPQVQFSLFHNRQEVFVLAPAEDFFTRVAEFFGKDIAERMTPVTFNDGYLGITALLGSPEHTRANARGQYIFVNRRYVRDRLVLHSIAEGYKDFVEPRRYPVVVIFLSLDPGEVDVNVHPTKIEVRLRNSGPVHSRIVSSIRDTLREKALALSLPQPTYPAATGPGASYQGPTHPETGPIIEEALRQFFERREGQAASAPARIPWTTSVESERKFDGRNLLQIHGNYIVEETPSGFNVIDQHALHERILYEELLDRIKREALPAQKLITPETVHLGGKDLALIMRVAETLRRLGVQIEAFGGNTALVRSVPQILPNLSPRAIVEGLLDELSEEDLPEEPEQLVEKVASVLACKAAVKSGERLSPVEMKSLIERSERLAGRLQCPHGRPTMLSFSLSQLEKRFRRK